MSGNENAGQYCYAAGDNETREWFHGQWRVWPTRTDERLTTNGSFHYGGVKAYRIENEGDPPMSREFAVHVGIMDRFALARIEARSGETREAGLDPEVTKAGIAPNPIGEQGAS